MALTLTTITVPTASSQVKLELQGVAEGFTPLGPLDVPAPLLYYMQPVAAPIGQPVVAEGLILGNDQIAISGVLGLTYYLVTVFDPLEDDTIYSEAFYFISGNSLDLDTAMSLSQGEIPVPPSFATEGYVNAAVAVEAAIRAAADTTLQDNINSEASTRASADSAETARAQAAEATNATAITTEATTRASADTTLQTNITNEASTRASADTTESTARSSADTTLQNNINSEASTRSTADTNEATARIAGDAATLTSAEAYTDTHVATEATARSTADTTLQSNITTEATTRASADTTLQTNITNEASLRVSGDAATLASANTYTDTKDSGIRTASVTLTHAQILAAAGTAVTLVPTPGAGLFIVPCYVVWELLSDGTPFVDSGSSFDLVTGLLSTPAWGLGFTSADGVFEQTTNQVVVSGLPTADQGTFISQTVSNVINQPLKVINLGTNLTGGGTSTLKVTVKYFTISV